MASPPTATPTTAPTTVVPAHTTAHHPAAATPPGVATDGGTGLRDGDVWQNRRIDVSNPGAHVTITAHGADWRLQNIAIVGGQGGDTTTPFTIRASVPAGETATIRALHLADTPTPGGDTPPGDAAVGGIRVTDAHAGRLVIDGVYVAGQPRGGLVATPDGATGAGAGEGEGEVVVTGGYFANNGVANCQLGVPTATLTDCVSRTDTDTMTGPDGRARGVWTTGGTTTLDACHVTMLADDYAVAADGTGTATLRDGAVRGTVTGAVAREAVDTTPRTYVPQGCPRSAHEAVTRPHTTDGDSDGGDGA